MNPAKKIYFYRQLSALLESGISLLRAFELLAGQEKGRFRSLLQDMHESIKSGSTLTEAVSSMKDIFSDFEIAIIHSGEVTGNLEVSLSSIVEYLERTKTRWQRFIIGMLYPAILLHAAILIPPVVTLFLDGLIPYLRAVLRPLICMYLIFSIILVIFRIIRGSVPLSALLDRTLWPIPIIGGIIRKLAISRFAASLGLSLRAGISPDIAIKTSSQVSGNAIIKSRVSESEKFLRDEGIAGVLKRTGIFPDMMIEMALTGERSGKIDEMLLRIALSFEEEANTVINRLLVVLPVLIYLAVALYIAYIIISFYSGYFQGILFQ